MDGLHLVPVATGLTDFEAKLLAARLGADGILWQTRGVVDSICPFGAIDVLVPTSQLDDARDAVSTIVEHGRAEPDPLSARILRPSWWFGLAAAGALMAVLVVRVVAVV